MDVRAVGEGRFDLRREPKILFEEYGLVPSIKAKSLGSSYSDVRRPKDNSFLKRNGIENRSNVEIYSRTSLGKRRRDSSCWSSMQDKMECCYGIDGHCGEGIGINCPGNWFKSGRMA